MDMMRWGLVSALALTLVLAVACGGQQQEAPAEGAETEAAEEAMDETMEEGSPGAEEMAEEEEMKEEGSAPAEDAAMEEDAMEEEGSPGVGDTGVEEAMDDEGSAAMDKEEGSAPAEGDDAAAEDATEPTADAGMDFSVPTPAGQEWNVDEYNLRFGPVTEVDGGMAKGKVMAKGGAIPEFLTDGMEFTYTMTEDGVIEIKTPQGNFNGDYSDGVLTLEGNAGEQVQ